MIRYYFSKIPLFISFGTFNCRITVYLSTINLSGYKTPSLDAVFPYSIFCKQFIEKKIIL